MPFRRQLQARRRCSALAPWVLRAELRLHPVHGGVAELRIGGGGLLECAGGVDALMPVVEALEGELARRAKGSAARGRACAQAEVRKDASDHGGILDRGDELHAPVACRAVKDVEAHAPPKQDRPGQAPFALGIIGAHQLRCRRAITSARAVGRGGRRRCWRYGV